MLLIVITLYLFQGFFNADAAPLSTIFPRQTSTDLGAPQECICPNTRSQWDIVWSCLATIFVCTWVSVHPNIPALGEPWWKKTLRRVELMFWSVIAPELMIWWAAQQWAAAGDLARKYKEHGWTMSHGYFIQMGGFMLYDNNKPIGVLGPDELDRLIKEEMAAMPRTTEQEIQDRSKSDGLSKALVIIQTTWFIGQCVARIYHGLDITELELTTLELAAVNGIMYVCWWFKPLDVQTTVRVDLLLPSPQMPYVPVDLVVQVDVIKRVDVSQIPQEFPSRQLELIPTPGSISEIGWDDATAGTTGIGTERENLITYSEVSSGPYQSIEDSKFQDVYSSASWLISGILFRWPATGVHVVLIRVMDIINSNKIDNGAMGVPMYYTSYLTGLSAEQEEAYAYATLIAGYPYACTGIVFGAFHYTGLGFSFPSLIEANIWRISSAIITGVPVIVLGFLIYASCHKKIGNNFFVPKSLENNFLVQKIPDLLRCLPFYFTVAALPFYILARLALLVVALTTLRNLPPEALETVKWTLFLPHI